MESIRLRAIEPEDLDFLCRWENDPAQWDYSDLIAPLSRTQLRNYIETYDPDPFHAGQLRIMISAGDNTPIGIVDLYKVNAVHARAMIGIFIDPEYRHRGIATSVLKRVGTYASQRLGLQQLAAMISADNAPSLALFRKAGYAHTGTLKKWRRLPGGFIDVDIYQFIFQ